jgi:hypothetical protein
LTPSPRRRANVTPSTRRGLHDPQDAIAAGRGGKSDYTKVKGEEGIASRRPERLLRAPRLSFQILELLRVARRVARVLGRHRAPLVTPMTGVGRDPAAYNCASSLFGLERFEETKALMRKPMPVARRVLGDCHDLTLKMRGVYANVLFADPGATLDDLREAVETLEDIKRIARRVLGDANPTVRQIVRALRNARETLRTRESPNT